jgi:hypothetical protein
MVVAKKKCTTTSVFQETRLKGRELNFEDILHYQKIIVALFETDKLMKEIDMIEIE